MRILFFIFLILCLPMWALAQSTQEQTLMDKHPRIIDQSAVLQGQQEKTAFPVHAQGGVSKFMRITDAEKGISDLMERVSALESQMAQMKAELEALKNSQGQNPTP